MLESRTGTTRKATSRARPPSASARARRKGATSARIGGPRDRVRRFAVVGADFAELPRVFLRVHPVEDDPVGDFVAFAGRDFALRAHHLFDQEMWPELVGPPGEGRPFEDAAAFEFFFPGLHPDFHVEGFPFAHLFLGPAEEADVEAVEGP